MNTKEFEKLLRFKWDGADPVPTNQPAANFMSEVEVEKEYYFKRIAARDLNKHAAFYALLGTIYKLLPEKFQRLVPRECFFDYIKAGRGEFKKGFTFGQGFIVPIFNSTSFGNMNNEKFTIYIKDLLPFIYSNILAHYYDVEKTERIVEQIEKEFRKLLKSL